MVKSKVVEVTKHLQQCLKETGLDNLDIFTLTTEEFENETSLVAEYVKKGIMIYAT